jgi:D-glycero-D-manno-heptose 1,7-bisphosphate phosphatase
MITNRPDIASGSISREEVEAMHALLRDTLPLDAVYLCPHRNQDSCTCRKPKPGLLLQAGKELTLNLSTSYFIGDQTKDVEAGKQASCTTILLDTCYNRHASPNVRVASLLDAAVWILQTAYPERI